MWFLGLLLFLTGTTILIYIFFIEKNILGEKKIKNKNFNDKNLKNEIHIRDISNPVESKRNLEMSQMSSLDLHLYITGFLYYDPSQSTTSAYVEKHSSNAEFLSNFKRLGNASLEWYKNKFKIQYKEGEIFLETKDILEIRFLNHCAIFILKNKPDYYFFSYEIQKLNQFLNKLKNNAKQTKEMNK